MRKYTENNHLVIRAEKGHNAMLAIVALFIGGLGAVNVIVVKGIYPLMISFLPLLILLRYWIATGRTIKMKREGCTVSFLWYKKEYTWSELRYIKYENAEDTILWYKTVFVKSVIFSRNPVHKPKWMDPAIYCMWLHPFSVFFVYFKPKLTKEQEKVSHVYCPLVCCIEEEKFRRYLTEWGVGIQDDEK